MWQGGPDTICIVAGRVWKYAGKTVSISGALYCSHSTLCTVACACSACATHEHYALPWSWRGYHGLEGWWSALAAQLAREQQTASACAKVSLKHHGLMCSGPQHLYASCDRLVVVWSFEVLKFPRLLSKMLSYTMFINLTPVPWTFASQQCMLCIKICCAFV